MPSQGSRRGARSRKEKPKAPRQRKAARATGTPGVTREIDLAEVTRLRALGLDTMADIARAMGIPKQTLSNPQHAIEVKEAVEVGRVQAKVKALEQYERAIAEKQGNLTGLVIFKMKQFDWTDRARIDGTVEIGEGARERLRDTIERIRAKRAAEGAS